MSESHWDEFNSYRGMWGVFNVEQPYEATLIAALPSEAEANAWIEAARADLVARPDDSDHGNAEHYAALPIRETKGEYWNSYEPAEGHR